MKKISTEIFLIVLGLIIFLLGGWIFLLSRNQKLTAVALENATEKLDAISEKVNEIAYRDQVIELANAELQLHEIQEVKNSQPIGFRIQENVIDIS